MRTTICDRCGKQRTGYSFNLETNQMIDLTDDGGTFLEFFLPVEKGNPIKVGIKRYDFCPSCVDALIKWTAQKN